MSTIENPQPPAECWPLEQVEIGEVLELAKVVRTMDDY